MNNAEYHADLTHLSSSSLKLLLQNPAQFYMEYVLGKRQDSNKPAFAEGSYTHTLILEPEKVSDYAIYPGLRRFGSQYDQFKIDNAGKTILTGVQEAHGQLYKKAYLGRAEAVKLLSGGQPEFTMMAERLGVKVKARADYINFDQGYIVDVKTTGLPSGPEFFKNQVDEYCYDLSAALYTGIAGSKYDKEFEFYWVVISKCDLDCQIYKAAPGTLAKGCSKVDHALALYKRCKETGSWSHEQPKLQVFGGDYEVLEV